MNGEYNVAIKALSELFAIFIVSIPFGIIGYLLAKEKGRNKFLWTILGIIPIIGWFAMSYFIGASNLNLEKKIDRIIELLQRKE